jgi:hypothetical protein
MAISLSVLSIACFIGAAISFFRYDSKYFDLLVLSGVIFIGTRYLLLKLTPHSRSLNQSTITWLTFRQPSKPCNGNKRSVKQTARRRREHRIIALWCWR